MNCARGCWVVWAEWGSTTGWLTQGLTCQPCSCCTTVLISQRMSFFYDLYLCVHSVYVYTSFLENTFSSVHVAQSGVNLFLVQGYKTATVVIVTTCTNWICEFGGGEMCFLFLSPFCNHNDAEWHCALSGSSSSTQAFCVLLKGSWGL